MAKAKRKARARHPVQPLVRDKHRVIRFKANKIIEFLLDSGALDLNRIAIMQFPREDRVQLAQLIGYSLDGFGTLSYVTDADYARAELSLNGRVEP